MFYYYRLWIEIGYNDFFVVTWWETSKLMLWFHSHSTEVLKGTVRNGTSNNHRIISENGCPIEPFLIPGFQEKYRDFKSPKLFC